MTTIWQSSKLDERHETIDFDCGVPEMNDWLNETAGRAQKTGVARVHVWTPRGSNRVVGYYALAPTQLMKNGMPRSLNAGFNTIPAYLIARLALDRSIQGHGYGTDLLLDAIEWLYDASENVGGRLILVDAIDAQTAGFYRHHGFISVEGDELRLVMKMATAEQILTTAEVGINVDPELGLLSLDIHKPDGTSTSALLNPDEADTLGARLQELGAARRANPSIKIDIRRELVAVLGRDVLND